MKTLEQAARMALDALEDSHQNINPERGFAEELKQQISEAITALREALEQPAQQEPVLWQILNGVCHAGVRSTENLAKEAAAGMQKAHDLGGSLAAFHVRPLVYGDTPQAQPAQQQSNPWVGLTDDERAAVVDEYFGSFAAALMIEAKLREKNT